MAKSLALTIMDNEFPITIAYGTEGPNETGIEQPVVPMMSPEEYVRLLKNLVLTGDLAQKHMGVMALPLEPTLRIITLNDHGALETQNEVGSAVGQRNMLIFDPEMHTAATALKTLRLIASALDLGRRDASPEDFGAIARGEMREIIGVSGAGVWTAPEKKLLQDYKIAGGFDYAVKEGTTRIVMDLPVDQGTTIPFKWDVKGFTMQAGGTIAIRPEELPDLIADLERIERGECSAQEALFNADGTAKHDVYGMFAGFRQSQYSNVPAGAIPAAEQHVSEARARLSALTA